MLIGGLEKITLIDYPGHIASIVFTSGCNFRCPFCHNPELVYLEDNQKGRVNVSERDLFDFLEKRKGKIEGVVITGGEPTLHHDLPKFTKKIKKMGYKVKLDTNGTNLEMVKKMVDDELIDYIAMDIKSDLNHYGQVVNAVLDLEMIKDSIAFIKSNGLPYEFRTTMLPVFITEEIFRNMGEMIKGAKRWYLQNFIASENLLDKNFKKEKSFTDNELEAWKKIGSEYVGKCDIR